MKTFKEAFDSVITRGVVVPPVRLKGTVGAEEPPPVDEEESDWTIKMAQSQKAVEELLRASQHPPASGGLQGSDIERFEIWRKKISRLLDKFSYGEEVEDQEEVRLGNTTNDRFRHLRP